MAKEHSRVLLVDDDPQLLQLIAMRLQAAGYAVTAVESGEAALAATATAAGLPVGKCDVYKLHLGGGFGRRGAVHDWVRQVVLIAKEAS